MMPRRAGPDLRGVDRAGGQRAVSAALCAALTLLAVAAALVGCSSVPELTGVRAVPVDPIVAMGAPPYAKGLVGMRLDTWDEPENLSYDRTLWSDLTSLRFTDAQHGVLILGPVGTG